MFIKKRVKNNRGVTLVELMIGVAIILIVVIPLANVLYKNLQGAVRFGDANKALQLAQELMEEIKQKKWDERDLDDGNPIPIGWWSPIGRDGGETAPDADGSNAAKLTWDDIDDYNGLIETPPRDKTNAANQNALKFTRQAQVRYVDCPGGWGLIPPGPFLQVTPTMGIAPFKEIIVTVSWGQFSGDRLVVVELRSIRANIKRY